MMSIKHFGIETTYNPFSNAEDLQQVSNAIFNIADEPNFATTTLVSASTGLVPTAISFLSADFSATILDDDGTTLLQILKAKLGSIGNNEYPEIDEIVWFDVEGMQSAFWIHSDYLGKQLKISGKFQTTAITADFLFMFPIGSIFISYNKTPPTFGVWRRTGKGRVLTGLNEGDGSFNTSRKIGGAKTNTLSVYEMPHHSHYLNDPGHSHVTAGSRDQKSFDLDKVNSGDRWGGASDAYHRNNSDIARTGIWLNGTGGNGAHNNLQPYITVYMFERIA